MILIVRDPQQDPGRPIKDALSRLGASSLGITLADHWPGTNLIKHQASLYSYRVDNNLRRTLKSVASGLFDWIHPALPEDPCFFRPDGTVILTTIAHERDAYLTLTDAESSVLSISAPELADVLCREGPASLA